MPSDRNAAQERVLYATNMLAQTGNIACVLRDEGPDAVLAAIRAALAMKPPPGIDPVVALVTVACAQLDPNANLASLLDWTTRLPPVCVETTVDDDLIRQVHMLTNGRVPASEVCAEARAEAIRQLLAQEYTVAEIAARIGMSERGVRNVRAKLAGRAPLTAVA